MVQFIKAYFYKLYSFLRNPINSILYDRDRKIDGSEISNRINGLKHLKCGKNIAIPEFCVFNGKIEIGDYTTLGIHNMFFGDVKIGKYCQIGAYVAIHGTNHPINHLTTYINYRLFDGELSNLKTSKPVRIGHDVWIGHGAIILSGVSIGNGAIIAAGSIVTKDVASYTIVAGNPAKSLKKRFDEQMIKEIEELRWWNLTRNELNKIKYLFFTDLSNFKSLSELNIK